MADLVGQDVGRYYIISLLGEIEVSQTGGAALLHRFSYDYL
jgi:hypothetical protein